MATIITIFQRFGRLEFSPSPATIAVNTSVVFRNVDADAHLPTLSGQGPGFWFTHPLAAFVPGRPADTSDEVLFTTAGEVSYVCAMPDHPGEGGKIIVQ